ncbi:thioredoxin fold domain-containing protein [Arsukibacterium sp.]|uniref:thioredoxin fold domain-containing protein n=1 Tax=Arsukibacterium sp. TaxID=1977258 RepID=UPI002FDB2CB7
MKKWLISVMTLALFSCKPIAEQPAKDTANAAPPVTQAPLTAELSIEHTPLVQRFGQVGLQVQSVQASPAEGLLQVMTNQGLFFSSADGRYLVTGNVLDLDNFQQVRGQLVPASLKEQQMRPYIVSKMAELGQSYIEYKARNEKHVISVFTDPSCGYCRKLHEEMADYNNAGITVRYYAFPRAGQGSDLHLQMQHIWCARNQNVAMDTAKAGKTPERAMCQNPVQQHLELAQSFGINGTPAIILADGQVIPGYQPAALLLPSLQSQ